VQDGSRLEQAGMERVDQTVFRADFACQDEVFVRQGCEEALDLPGGLEERLARIEPLFGPPDCTMLVFEPREEHVGAELAEVVAKRARCVMEAVDREQVFEWHRCAHGAPIQTRDAIVCDIVHESAGARTEFPITKVEFTNSYKLTVKE